MEIFNDLFGSANGNVHLVITIVGTIIAIVCGAIIGKYGIYFKLNRTNNFASDTTSVAQINSPEGPWPVVISGIVCLGFAGFAGFMGYNVYPKEGIKAIGVCGIFCVLFGVIGIFLIINGIKMLITKQDK